MVTGCDPDKGSNGNEGNGKVVAAEYRGDYFWDSQRQVKLTLTKDKILTYFDSMGEWTENWNFTAWTEGNELWAFIEEGWIDSSKLSSKTKVNFNIGILDNGKCNLRGKVTDQNHAQIWTKE
jgi:hypothetical protein